MRFNAKQAKAYIVFAGDTALLYGALLLTLVIRYRELNPEVANIHFVTFTPLFLALLIIFYANRLYDLISQQSITLLLRQTLYSLLLGAAISVGYFYFLGAGFPGIIEPRTNLALFFLIFTMLFFLWRRFANRFFGKALIARVLLVGEKSETDKLSLLLQERPEYGYRIIYASDKNDWDFAFLQKLIQEKNITAIIASTHSIKSFAPHIAELVNLKIDFWDLLSFYEARLERIPLSLIENSWLLEKVVWREPRFAILIKTITDRTLAVTLLALTLPLWPIIALAIKLTSPGAVFYAQTRIGYRGRPFTLLKFRTMRRDAEQQGPQWANTNDPRITPVGKFLRKLQLDELPQIWNILKGEMSFVGPRPERPEFVEQLKSAIPFYDLRHLIKPGLTGWAQLNFRYGASIEDSREKLEYDLYYVKNRSLALDLAVILKTLNVILRGGTGR